VAHLSGCASELPAPGGRPILLRHPCRRSCRRLLPLGGPVQCSSYTQSSNMTRQVGGGSVPEREEERGPPGSKCPRLTSERNYHSPEEQSKVMIGRAMWGWCCVAEIQEVHQDRKACEDKHKQVGDRRVSGSARLPHRHGGRRKSSPDDGNTRDRCVPH